jgi:DNA-binding beta-propeller fold protein YncE
MIVLGTGLTLLCGRTIGAVARKSTSQSAQPPAERLRFVREFSGPDDLTKGLPSPVEKSLGIIFGPADQRTLFTNLEKPFAVTTDSTHRVFVADPTAHGVHVFDFVNYKYFFLGGPGSKIRSPVGVAIDANDQIYITDPIIGLVLVYDSKGKFLRYLGKVGDGESYFQAPTGIAIEKRTGYIYVCDTPRHMVIMLDKEGHILGHFGKRLGGNGPGDFRYPTRILTAGEDMFVLDTANSRLQILDLSGHYRREIRIPELSADTGLALDAQKNIYISNLQLDAIDVFTYDGKFLYRFGSIGAGPGEFRRPSGMWVESGNRLYVADTMNKRVQLFEIQGAS